MQDGGKRQGNSSRAWIEDVVAHFMGVTFTFGYFTIVFLALIPKWVDLKDPAVTAFIGTALGYTVGKLDLIFLRYFRPTRRKEDSTSIVPASVVETIEKNDLD